MVPKDELLAYAKAELRSKGFKKRNDRWTKDTGEFTLVFFVQGSSWNKESYYIRPGVFINELPRDGEIYGHIWRTVRADSIPQIFVDVYKFYNDYSDKSAIKKKVREFSEREARNPPDKRREGTVDLDAEPGFKELFSASDYVLNYISENY